MTVTTRGIALVLAGTALLAGGFGLGYPELAMLGCAALLAVAAAAAYAGWQPRLAVHRSVEPDRVTRGQPSAVALTVHNAGRLRPATLVGYDRCGDSHVPVPLLRLRPGRDATVSYPVPTTRRGVVPVGPLAVTRTDPLGLVTAARRHGDLTRVWVHPRQHPLAATPAGVTRSLDGRLDRVPHGGITFAALRQYVVGDELRHVHWRTSARVGELMVREHVDTSLPRLAVLLDDRVMSWPGATGGTAEGFESACEAAASIVVAAVREDLSVTLHVVGSCAPSGTAGSTGARVGGVGRAGPLLDRLAEAALTSTSDGVGLAEAAARLRQHRVGDTLVYLTGAGGLADLGLVAALRGTYPAVVVGVLGGGPPAPRTDAGVLVLAAVDGSGFAAAWDEVRAW